MGYAGGYRSFTYASWVLAAISALVALIPFLYIWQILRDVLAAAPRDFQAANIPHYGWMAVLFAILSYLIYVAALLCSHLSAFRVATNLRLQVAEHLSKLPLGFTESFGSGKLRKIIQESTGAAEPYLAHQLPDKWNTSIGENGCALSGGERQRVSIARAFLKDAPIILLDEATASLDVKNETLIQTALSRLIQDKTVLVIAHRMRTVAGAGKIVVLSDGVVAEQGKPQALYAENGLYTHMVDLQNGSQNWTI